jgi:hypothetical protein
VEIHACPDRIIFNSDNGQNENIKILVILCEVAKQRGDQYTKRMLPAFVIPECNVMLSNVMKYIKQCPQERINYAKAEIILGIGDHRTIRKHILLGRQIMEETNRELTQVLSGLASFTRLPEQKPGAGRHERLAATVDEIESAITRMHGAGRVEVPAIGYVHVVYMFHRARNPVKVSENFTNKPLGHVLSNLAFTDTS